MRSEINVEIEERLREELGKYSSTVNLSEMSVHESKIHFFKSLLNED